MEMFVHTQVIIFKTVGFLQEWSHPANDKVGPLQVKNDVKTPSE